MGTQTSSISGKGSSCYTSCPLGHGPSDHTTGTLKFASAMGTLFTSTLLEIKVAAKGLPSVRYPGILWNVRCKEGKWLSWILPLITLPGNQSQGKKQFLSSPFQVSASWSLLISKNLLPGRGSKATAWDVSWKGCPHFPPWLEQWPGSEWFFLEETSLPGQQISRKPIWFSQRCWESEPGLWRSPSRWSWTSIS